MAQNVKINGVTYQDVPSVQIPKAAGGGNATFYDTSGATATADKILSGFNAFGPSGEIQGSATVPAVSQDSSSHVLNIA